MPHQGGLSATHTSTFATNIESTGGTNIHILSEYQKLLKLQIEKEKDYDKLRNLKSTRNRALHTIQRVHPTTSQTGEKRPLSGIN